MAQFICVRAFNGGRIGPNSDSGSWTFASYDEAMAFMERDIAEHGGGEFNYDFGTGYAEDGEVAYEIFMV